MAGTPAGVAFAVCMALVAAPAGLKADPATGDASNVTISSADECGVYAAILGSVGSKDQGLWTQMEDSKTHSPYEIRCDWTALGVTPPKLIGLPSPECVAAQKTPDQDRICGLPPWMITLSRPVFGVNRTTAAARVDLMYHAPQGWYGGHGDTCVVARSAGKWRIVSCDEAWIS